VARDLELNVKSKTEGAGLTTARAEVDRLARAADHAADQFRQATRDAAQLDRKLLETKLAAAALAREFNKTGSASIKKDLDAQRAAAAELKRLRADIVGDSEVNARRASSAYDRAANDLKRKLKSAAQDGGIESASTFASAFQGSLLRNPTVLGVGAALGALLAIPIGAAIGGAVLGAAGVGGAALAGLAASKADTSGQVAAQGKDLVASLNAQFLKGGQSAVEPLLKGIHELQIATDNLHIDRVIQDAAKYIQPLAAAAGRFAEYLSEGADILVRNAGPVVGAIADELPVIGRAFKQFAEDVSGGSQGGADALKDLLEAIANIIIGAGKFIGFMEDAYHAIKQFGDGVTSVVDKLAPFFAPATTAAGLLALFGQNANDAKAYAIRLGDANSDLSGTMADLSRQIEQVTLDFGALVDKQVNAREAAIAYEQSLDDLKSSMDAHSHSTDINTEAGRKNVGAVDDLIKKAREHRQALLDQGKSLAEADAAYDSDIARVKALLHQLGFTNAEIQTLIGLADHIPKGIKINVSAPGLSSTLGMLGQLKNLSHQIGDVVVAAGLHPRAAGGPVVKGQPYKVGERGEELFVPGENGRIIPAGPTATLMRQSTPLAAAWGPNAAASKSTGVTINFAGNTNSAFATAFMKLVRTGDIQLGVN
jgi:ABC-type transporter Mla subunit MlaD